MSRRRLGTVLLGAALLLPALLPLVLDAGLSPPRLRPAAAVLDGHDAGFDLLRTAQVERCLRTGQYAARWSPDLAWGYGVPLFQFYALGPYYLAGTAALAGLSPAAAVKLVHALGLALSALGAFLLGRDIAGRRAGFLLAALYTYAPYHLADIYVRSSLGESLAFVWPPLFLWGARRLARHGSVSGWLLALASACGLILTHNVAAMILFPAMAAYVIVLAASPHGAAARKRLLTLLVAPVGITAYFWLPALAELRFLPGEFTSHQFRFDQHFLPAAALAGPPWSVSPPDPAAGFRPQLGWALLLSWGLALAAAIRGAARGRRWLVLTLALLPLAALLCLRASAPLWEALTPLQLVQLPWRFLLLGSLAGALAAAWIGGGGAPPRWLAAGLTAVAVAAGLPHCRAHTFPVERLVPLWQERMAGVPVPGPAAAGAVNGEDFGRAAFLALPHPLSTTSLQMEYLPRTVRELPPEPAREVFVAGPGCSLDQVRVGSDQHFFDAVCESDGTVTANLFYFPGWTVEVDKEEVRPGVHPRFGTMTIAIPAGAHRVKLEYGDTPMRRAAKLLSLLTLVAVAVGHHAVSGRWGGT